MQCLWQIPLLVSTIYGVYETVIYRRISDEFLSVSVNIGTYMRLDLPRDALAAPASACVAGKVQYTLSLCLSASDNKSTLLLLDQVCHPLWPLLRVCCLSI